MYIWGLSDQRDFLSPALFRLGTRRLYAAFTIVELLVVIAIVGILMALALPAIQAARESSRQLVCQDNLRQIGLGIHNHLSQQGHFPTGGWGHHWTGDPDRG